MKKTHAIIALLVTLLLIPIGVVIWNSVNGNQQIVGAVYHFDTGYVKLPDGEIVVGHVVNWAISDDSDMIQVRINNSTYYTNASNVVLVHNH